MKYLSFKKSLFLIFLVAFGISSCKSVQSSQDIISKYAKNWYFNPTTEQGGKRRLNINNTMSMIITEGKDATSSENNWIAIDTIEIIENKIIKSGILLIITEEQENKRKYQPIIIHHTDIKGFVTFHEERGEFFTLEDALKAGLNSKTQNVLEQPVFSDEYNYELAKPLEQLTKEDYTKTLEYVVSLKSEIKGYAEGNYKEGGQSKESLASGRKTDLIEKKLFLMGYDGYGNKKELGKFESDTKIQELKKQIDAILD
jgi:hypothetical protein